VKSVTRYTAIFLVFIAAAVVNAFAADGRTSAPYTVAAKVLRLANLGDLKSQTRLGLMYSKGLGVPQDYYEAAKWYYRSADRGDPFAQFALGMMYNKGQGVRRDYVLAEMWLNLSASRTVGDNHDFVARVRDALASKMTAEQVATAQRLAVAWHQSP
jgi:TPR repeat protein